MNMSQMITCNHIYFHLVLYKNDYLGGHYIGSFKYHLFFYVLYSWADGEPLTEESFQIWRDGVADVYNTISFDCVKFTHQGWQVHQGFCSNELLSFACRQQGTMLNRNNYIVLVVCLSVC